jgi:hypothetical protein
MRFYLEGLDNNKLAVARHIVLSYLSSRNALTELGVLRSERQIQEDYAEWIVASYLNLTLCDSTVEKILMQTILMVKLIKLSPV